MNDPFRDQTGPPAPIRAIHVSRFRPFALMAVAVTGVAGCATLGALTNAVNGWVSPDYFRTVLDWSTMSDVSVWRASIAQGILEGVMFGLVLSAIYTAVVGISSGVRCPYLFAATHLAGILAAALACWAIGGILAIGLLALSPEFYRHTFYPYDFGSMAPYAWVGGSIWGVEFGGLFCLVIGAVLFRARWIRSSEKLRPAGVPGSVLRESAESSFGFAGEGGLPSGDIKR